MVRDKSQEKVIYADVNDSMVIIAAPGYGKTYTMARRIEYLVNNNKLEGNRKILGLTFSNAAANEMHKKLEVQDPSLKNRVNIINYHAFCYKILRRFGFKIKYPNDFSILTEGERNSELSDALLVTGIEETDLKPYLTRLKEWILNKKIPPLATGIANESTTVIEKAYKYYVQKLLNENKIDFDLIIEKVIELWNTIPDILDFYRKSYQYLIIDEFQDTNYLQYRIIKLLIEGNNPTDLNAKLPFQCYCDPYQSIYGFQGALSEKYKMILQDFNPKLISLRKNYRTTSKLVQNVCLQLRENRRITNDIDQSVNYIIFNNQEEESKFLIDKIRRIIKNGIFLEDICIIARTYERLEIIKSFLEKEDVDFIYLKDFRSETIEDKYTAIFTIFNQTIARRIKKGKVSQIYLKICRKYNYNMEEIVINTIYEYIVRYENRIRGKNYELWQEAQMIKNDILLELNWGNIVREKIKDRIFLSVVHQVKGLEFKQVLFIGIENYELPSGRNCYNKCGNKLDIDLSEETNIFYVGISRTIYELIFTASKEVVRWGQKKKRALSCLIEKIDNFVNFVDYNTGKLTNYSDNKCWLRN
jgi:superfamily I DNA/RNA helicase